LYKYLEFWALIHSSYSNLTCEGRTIAGGSLVEQKLNKTVYSKNCMLKQCS